MWILQSCPTSQSALPLGCKMWMWSRGTEGGNCFLRWLNCVVWCWSNGRGRCRLTQQSYTLTSNTIGSLRFPRRHVHTWPTWPLTGITIMFSYLSRSTLAIIGILTRCSAIAKMTARCALYIGHSTLIFFTPTPTTWRGFDSERI